MSKFCLIGNAPSSGSTLLADILDSTQLSACGPELEFFCNKNLYAFNSFKTNPAKTSYISVPKTTGLSPNYDRLNSYGLTKKQLFEMVKTSTTASEFFANFSTYFLQFRNKNENGIVFEKTPQNINCIPEFLNENPTNYFIFLIRNPLYVYNSVLKRGWGNYSSIATWLVYAAHAIPYLKHDRLIVVKYEDLVEDPFQLAANILKKTSNITIAKEEIINGFKNNEYRKESSKGLSTWEVNDNRNNIVNANKKLIEKNVLEEFSKSLNFKISKRFANHYTLPQATFIDAIKTFGYTKEINELLSASNVSKELPYKTVADYQKASAKWLREITTTNSKFFSPSLFLNVLEKV